MHAVTGTSTVVFARRWSRKRWPPVCHPVFDQWSLRAGGHEKDSHPYILRFLREGGHEKDSHPYILRFSRETKKIATRMSSGV